MQRLSLKVLLRFLSTYSHWNLVRRSEGYHLYFVTKESAGHQSSTVKFPGGNGRRQKLRWRTTGSRLRRQEAPVPTVRRSKIKSGERDKCGKPKDVFIFSPIFETVEEAVQVGIGPVENSIIDEKSKRSSYDSLAWDDFLPLKEDDDSMGDDSFETIENSTDIDSKESTPFCIDGMSSDFGVSEIRTSEPYNACVRNQADKLLKDMLQLRREIEDMNCSVRPAQEDEVPIRRTNEERTEDSEQQLMDRLESMTQEVKLQMEIQGKDEKKGGGDQLGKINVDDDTKIRNFFKSIVEKKGVTISEKPNVERSDENAQNLDTNNPSEVQKDSLETVKDQQEQLSRSVTPVSEQLGAATVSGVRSKEQNGKAASPNVSEAKESEEKEATVQADVMKRREKRKKGAKSSRPSYNTDSLKRKAKNQANDVKNIDVPFCGYNQYRTGSSISFFTPLERRKKKKEMNTILSPHDKQAAKELLNDLVEIRNKKSNEGGENNQILESMISLISLSSTNLALPVPASNSAVQFKDLFDFEVNYRESREVFEKLAMNNSNEHHTLEDLFPWSDREGGNLNKLKL